MTVITIAFVLSWRKAKNIFAVIKKCVISVQNRQSRQKTEEFSVGEKNMFFFLNNEITCSLIFSFGSGWGGGGNRSERYSMYISSLSAGSG